MSLSKSASDRVLFNEDYLDKILPYLSTGDLKSVRLVTPFWNKIGTKFLGRKSFKPIRFSDINLGVWMSLKEEIEASLYSPEEDSRIKLFQGFDLTWLDVNMMFYDNLIASFKPSQIIIKGKDVNPGYSLTTLLAPILDTLTDVTLKIHWDVLIKDFSFLVDFAQLRGMRLKVLHLEIFQDKERFMDRQYTAHRVYQPFMGRRVMDLPFNRRVIDRRVWDRGFMDQEFYGSRCSASPLLNILSNILANQAPTLEELDLKIECNVEKGTGGDSKIQLPIFPRLTSLSLALRLVNPYQDPLSNFQQFNFAEKFPKLDHLHLTIEQRFQILPINMHMEGNEEFQGVGEGDTLKLTRDHPLTKLNINFPNNLFSIPLNGYFNKLLISFPFVEEFTAKCFRTDGAGIPWVNTLRNLDISGSSSTFNLVHLKNVQTLHYTLEDGKDIEDVNGLINMLQRHYRELPFLKKFHISGFKITDEQKIQIQEALPPQFRDILTIDETTNEIILYIH